MALSALYRPRLGALTERPVAEDGMRGLRLVVLAALVVLLAELIYIPLRSPRFAVTAVVVRGDARVAAQVAPRLVLRKGTNIFLAPLGQLVKLAQRDPAVREARVDRDWQRRLIVTLERREAMAVIREAKQARLVDPRGVLFTIRNEWGWGLPELVAPHLSKGDVASAEGKAELRELLSALRALGPDPRLRIARLEMDRVGRIEAALDSGARIRLGSIDQLALKTKLLAGAIGQLGADKIAFLDLSNPASAYWRERTEPKPGTER